MSSQPSLPMGSVPSKQYANVESFEFEPIKGYPMLNWQGKRPFTSTHYYPAQLKETYGDPTDAWRNKLFWGDNLQVMSHMLKEFRGKVNLVYIDPPYDSKAIYKKTIHIRGQNVTNDQNAFEEKQYTDIWTNDEYLQFMFERLILIRELLSDEGTLYLHADFHKVHYLRCLLDEIFGPNNFINEIVWKRRGGALNNFKSFGSVTDSILMYGKSEKYIFSPQKTKDSPEAQQYIKERFIYDDGDGRLYSRDPITNPSANPTPSLIYTYKGYKPPEKGWAFSQETMKKWDELGKLYFPPDKSQRIRRKTFLAEYDGQPIQNFWGDIYVINSQAIEAEGYPTQKPEALLERVILTSTNPGDLVFDAFMGSGTTQAAAMKLGRRFIGADINLGAVQITTKRLSGIANELNAVTKQGALEEIENEIKSYYTGFEVYNVNYYDMFRNPLEAKDLLLEALEVQRLDAGNLFDAEKDGRMIKVMPVNRIATRADLNELIHGFDLKAFNRRQAEHPNKPVEKITLVCMGHELDLAAALQNEVQPYKIDVEVVDILRDKQDLHFKRDSEAKVKTKNSKLIIESFYPMNLLQKLSMQQENVKDWRELVESVMIDWNYDGAILQPAVVDIPERDEFVRGTYPIPDDAGTICVKITDLLSESLEVQVQYG